jgi:hypothetical protein
MHLPYQHNFRTLKNYGNKNIDASLTHLNTCIVNNLKNGETYLAAFNRLHESGEFKGQLKVQGAVDKQTKFLDEFLIYPPYEKITEMSLEEQEAFFKKELLALKKYFPHMIVLSANIHRDEVFHPLDEEMKVLFPEGKVTRHMHVIAIPIVYDKKTDCKKISITELWKGKFSYRKFQDYMYNSVAKEYGFDRGEMHEFGEAEKHLEVEAFKLKEAEKSLNKLEAEIELKEQSLVERAKDLELEEHINLFTARAVTYWLSKYCRDAGVTYKSPHCTRRTTASRLSNAGLPLDMIRDILGQVDERTTLTYIFNPNTEQENLDIMN